MRPRDARVLGLFPSMTRCQIRGPLQLITYLLVDTMLEECRQLTLDGLSVLYVLCSPELIQVDLIQHQILRHSDRCTG